MATGINRQILLKSRPAGIPQSENFQYAESPIPEPADGQVLVRNLFVTAEPAMRGWVSAVANYSEPVPLGGVMRSPAVARIIRSRQGDYTEGEHVTGFFGWQDYAAVDAKTIQRKVTETDLPLSAALGVLSLNGVTAYFGLLDVGQPRAGETVAVSTAAGSVGSCVGQIARLKGCRAVGIAGGPVKIKLCREAFGFDAAVDYKAADFEAALDAACPQGIDVYYDNTAGAISDAVMKRLNVGARVVICGTASVASWDPIPLGPRVERHLLVKRARMQGLIVFDYAARFPEAWRDLAAWVRSGQIRYREDILDGLDKAPDAIAGLYRGDNLGKRIIKL